MKAMDMIYIQHVPVLQIVGNKNSFFEQSIVQNHVRKQIRIEIQVYIFMSNEILTRNKNFI